MKHVACYQKGYPRPQFVRKEWSDLNGEWKFAFDDGNIGEAEGWYHKGIASPRTIVVPFSYQTKASRIEEKERHDNIWYERELSLPGNFSAKKRLWIWFEGSDYVTKVWVDGIFIGKHEGGYCRFGFDVTDAVLTVKNVKAHTLTVKCEDSYDATQPRGKQKWMDNPYGCWYVETNGLWKSVWAECVNAEHIDRIKFEPNRETYAVDFEAEIKGGKGAFLITQISKDGKAVAENRTRVMRDKFSYSVDLVNDYESFKIHWWSYDNPALYDVKFMLADEKGNILDEVGSYLGFRSFYVNKDALILNNGPTYLKMVLEQGYFRESGMTYPDEQAIADELILAKELGFNGVRMHQKIEDERFFYYADILGVATWAEMPSAYEFRDATVDKVTAEWMEVVKQHYNHPSVFAWVPFNESWGVPRIMSDKKEQRFTEALYYLTKAYDGMRPVISNDGWEHTTSDIITLHNYDQNPEKFGEFYSFMDKVLANENLVDYSQWRLTFAGEYGYRGQPVMITEFAGIGYDVERTNGGWGYGDKVMSGKAFAERLAGLVKKVRENHRICGFCITQLTDVESEINGLCDADHKPKIDKNELAKAVKQ